MKLSSPLEKASSLLEERRLLLSLTLLVALLIGTFATQHSQAIASSSATHMPLDCPFSQTFDGVFGPSATNWGATALIGGYQPSMWCSDTSNWTMIFNPLYSPLNGYAQVGYLRSTLEGTLSTVNEYFHAYTFTTGTEQFFLDGVDISNWGGSSDTFTVYYDSSTHLTRFGIAPNWIDNVNLDWSATQSEFFNEVHSTNDQVLGGFNHHTIFDNVQYLQNGAWHAINAQSGVDNDSGKNPNGGISATTGGRFWLWDNRVP